MRVLGVDPGSLQAGWGLLAGDPRRPELIEFGVLSMPPSLDLSRRLHRLHEQFQEVLVRLSPDVAAVESPFHGVNPRSALHLAHARGVLLACLGREGVDVVEYSPAEVKQAVTGNGRAMKEQVQDMVGRLLGRPDAVRDPDVADALAVAICHLSGQRYREALARAQVEAER